MVKKEIILEGLSCAHCANKIEEKVSRISNVNSASLNFMSKTLTIETGHIEKIDEILKQATKIILRLEPSVIIKEKVVEKKSQKVLTVMGLDCANCAAKIEKEIKRVDGIKNATMDFVTGKLILEFIEKHRIKEVTEAAIKVAKSLEPGIEIIDQDMCTERGNGKIPGERDNPIEHNNNKGKKDNIKKILM